MSFDSSTPGSVSAASKEDMKENLIDGSLIIDPSLTSEENLNIVVRDHVTKRLFEATFTKEDLVKSGFNPMFTVPQMVAVVKGAVNGEPATTISTGYVDDPSAENKDKKGEGVGEAAPTSGRPSTSKKPGSRVIIDVKKSYFHGSALVILIVHDLSFFKSTYTLVLKEVAQDSVEILEQRLNDANDAITELTRKMKEEMVPKSEVDSLQKELVSQQESFKSQMDDFKSLLTSMKSEMDELKKGGKEVPQLGCWQSTTSSGNYKSWNKEVSAPPSDLFSITDSSTKVTIKKTGLYHIHGMATSSAGCSICVYVNGTTKTNRIANANYTNSSSPFDLTIKLTAGQYIQIYSNSHTNPGAVYNTLTIEKLD